MTSILEYDILINRIKGGEDMEFLNELYSNEYFGIGLFIVITILAFSFLVILFFGKKDEKARLEKEQNKENEVKIEEIKLEETTTPEAMETITLNEEAPAIEEEKVLEESEDTMEFTPLNSSELEEPQNEELEVFEEKKLEDLDPFVTSNLVLNTDYINEGDQIEEPTYIESEVPTVEEEPSIDEVLSKYDAIEEQTLQEENTPVILEEQESGIFEDQEKEEEKTTAPFSSVYLDKEETKVEEPEDKVDLDKTRNLFELPKRVDLPKRSDNAINDNIISSMNEHKE